MNWAGIIVLSGGCYLAKLAGVVAGDRFSAALGPVTTLLPPALFSGIVVLMTVVEGTELVLDARLVGVAVAVVAVLRRAPFVVVVGLAMIATAGLRLMG